MKKHLFISALILGLTCAVNAQEKPQPKDRLAALELTAQQKSSVDSVRKAFDMKRAEVKKDAALSKEEKEAQLKAIRKEQNKQINAILTPEQREQLKKHSKPEENH